MPYSQLEMRAFWRSCRETPQFLLEDIYRPKFDLETGMHVGTAGSCFAQNIGRYIRSSNLNLVDTEPAPARMQIEVAQKFGYSLFSARYGNIYTPRQLLQLLQDAMQNQLHDASFFTTDSRWVDGLRPNVEPQGLDSLDLARRMRKDHLCRVIDVFARSDVFIFTLGLTETWCDVASGLVYPTAPGTIAGQYSHDQHGFLNLSYDDCLQDLMMAIDLMRDINPALKIILTVSPVPLTATASGHHVLQATTHSKSILRAVAGEIAFQDPMTDYFPSFEIITGTPFGARFFHENLRNVTDQGVDTVMSVFFGAYRDLVRDNATYPPAKETDAPDEAPEIVAICEEAFLETYATQALRA